MLDTFHTIAEIIQSIFTVFAIIMGGIWTYTVFVRQRQRYPRVTIKHALEYRKISNELILLSVDIFITNSGSVLLPIVSGRTQVKQVVPPTAELADRLEMSSRETIPDEFRRNVAKWDLLCYEVFDWTKSKKLIEPGEVDQVHCEFTIRSGIQTVILYTYLENYTSRPLGWQLMTVHDIDRKKEQTKK